MKNKYLIFTILILIVLTFSCCAKPDPHAEYTAQKIKVFREENQRLQNIDAVFLGDSWTEGYNIAKFYPKYQCLNRGIGGDRTNNLLDRLKDSVYDANPKVVVLLIGGNDMLAGRSNDYILDNVESIVLGIKENLPKTQILMQSYYHLTYNYARHNTTLIELSNGIDDISKKYGLKYVEIYPFLIDQSTAQLNHEYAQSDGVHINDKGYEVITRVLKPVLYQMIESCS